jgi:hypothetical protein
MATSLNVFKTTTATPTTTNSTVYTAPANYTGIVLMAQITNITDSAASITVTHFDGISTETELLKNFEIPGYDSAAALTGKLVLQTGHSLKVVASANATFKIVLSLLESANE